MRREMFESNRSLLDEFRQTVKYLREARAKQVFICQLNIAGNQPTATVY